jgi:archaellum component FlaC
MSQAAENTSSQINQLQNTIKRLEKENKSLTEKIELSSKHSQSEQGGLEKRIEKTIEERDRIKEDFEMYK